MYRLCQTRSLFYPLFRIKSKRLARKHGIDLLPNLKCGYGLYIGHGIGTIINPTAIIGNNVNLSQFTTIGSNQNKAAVIGNNVYIGPNVCIVENVHIGSNSTIGAGSVVVKDVQKNTTVAGNPAKHISDKTPGRFIGNPFHLHK